MAFVLPQCKQCLGECWDMLSSFRLTFTGRLALKKGIHVLNLSGMAQVKHAFRKKLVNLRYQETSFGTGVFQAPTGSGVGCAGC